MSALNPISEALIYARVESGELEIRPDGTIWKVMDRRNRVGPLGGHGEPRPCTPHRAERPTRAGYLRVQMTITADDGKRTTVMTQAHRLVWRYFFGAIPDGLTVNHKNGVKHDNRPDNFELATLSQQQEHSYQVLGRQPLRGESHNMAKLTAAQVADIRTRKVNGEKQRYIAERYGMSGPTISNIIHGKTWKTS